MTGTALRADETTNAHLLDPASAAEYLRGRDIMAAAGLLTGPVRCAYYGLDEPPKAEVLAGHSAGRRLRAFLVNTDTGESIDVVVSLPDPPGGVPLTAGHAPGPFGSKNLIPNGPQLHQRPAPYTALPRGRY
jgi:hypothetical protein